MSVFDLLETQIMPKFLVHVLVVVILHVESKNEIHLQFGAPNPKRRTSGAAHREKKPVLRPKVCHVTKITPNFLKFGLEVL